MANYHSPRRAQAAEATRTTIVETARRLFSERGYAAVTIAQIADGAGVAVPTVYASAGGKAQILRLLIDEAVHDPAVAQTLAVVAASGSAAEMVRATAAGVRRTHERHWPTLVALIPQCYGEPAAAQVLEAANREFLAALTDVAGHLITAPGARPGLTVTEAVDFLWFHLGQSAWFSLVRDRAWTFDRAESWLADNARRALCAPS
ncbi:TetR/AcrR family transcriptional regulator [Amycolatopsis sp. NPDC051903]|uniref:TetR/AcrR family transcriptional regulator n=1 Tax=Amycolatopsis sp. NPDC051903 TaxID=3363936 RepID=UPI0037AC4423